MRLKRYSALSVARGPDVNAIRALIDGLRNRRLYIVKFTKTGNSGKYSYLNVPVELIERYGERYTVENGDSYTDYITTKDGNIRALRVSKGAYRLRFPRDDVSGYVVVERTPRGFRVYY